MKYYFLFFFLLFSPPLHGHGFQIGTLVKTPSGYTPIEKLKIGDPVYSFDDTLSKQCQTSIVAIKQEQHAHAIEIVLDELKLVTSTEQPFLLPTPPKIDVQDPYDPAHLHDIVIEAGGKTDLAQIDLSKVVPLFSHATGESTLQKMGIVEGPITLYSLSLKEYHNYFVTKQDILTHNFCLTIPICSWGVGQATWLSLGTLVSALVTAVVNEAFCWFLDFLGRETGPKREAPKYVPVPESQYYVPNTQDFYYTTNPQYYHAADAQKEKDPQHNPEGSDNNNDDKNNKPKKNKSSTAAASAAAAAAAKAKKHLRKQKSIAARTVSTQSTEKLKFTPETFAKSVEDALNPNNLRHTIAEAKHGLKDVTSLYNTEKEFVEALLKKCENVLPADGLFKNIPINLNGYEIYTRGRVIEGKVKLGTYFIPEFFKI